MSGFSESEGDNADAIDQVDGQAQIDGDQEAVIQDRTESGDGGSAECTVKVDPQTSTWTKRRRTPEARKMAGESGTRRPLFDGAVSTAFPVRFQDVSNIREVPDRQEVLVDPTRDESLIFELIDLKGKVEDGGSALWFLRDVANEQDAGDNLVVEHSGTIELAGLRSGEAPAVAGTAIGKLAVSKGRQGREAHNIVRLRPEVIDRGDQVIPTMSRRLWVRALVLLGRTCWCVQGVQEQGRRHSSGLLEEIHH